MFENMYGALQGGVLSPDLFEVLLSDTSANLDSAHVSDIQIPYLLYMPTKTEVVVWVTVTSSLRNISVRITVSTKQSTRRVISGISKKLGQVMSNTKN